MGVSRPEREPGDQDQWRSLLHDMQQYVATGMLLCDDEDVLVEDDLRARLRTGRMLFNQLSAMVGGETVASPAHVRIDVGDLVDEAVEIFRHGHPELHIRVTHDDALICEVERESLHRAVTNLLENAARAAGRGGRVTVGAFADGGYVRVEVADDGRGFGQIPRGSGRGLSSVSELVRSARGRIEIHSGHDTGTRVVLVLPRPTKDSLR